MLSVTAHTTGLEAMKGLEAFGPRLPSAQANVLNRVGTKAKNRVIPALTRQTGLTKRIITKAVRMNRASPQNSRVILWTRGGEISLRFFGAHEIKGGVEATVHGDRMFYARGFRRSGRGANRRMVPKLNKQVYINEGTRWRGHITVEKSGVMIPAEMIRGETAKAFWDVVSTDLAPEVEAELAKLLSGGR